MASPEFCSWGVGLCFSAVVGVVLVLAANVVAYWKVTERTTAAERRADHAERDMQQAVARSRVLALYGADTHFYWSFDLHREIGAEVRWHGLRIRVTDLRTHPGPMLTVRVYGLDFGRREGGVLTAGEPVGQDELERQGIPLTLPIREGQRVRARSSRADLVFAIEEDRISYARAGVALSPGTLDPGPGDLYRIDEPDRGDRPWASL